MKSEVVYSAYPITYLAIMSERPTILKILEFLRDSGTATSASDITNSVQESQDYISNALATLVKEDAIILTSGKYNYTPTPKTEQFFGNLLEVYRRVSRRPEQESIVRGLLSQLPAHYLLRAEAIVEVLSRENMDREESNQLMQQESDAGYLKKVKVLFSGPKHFSCPVYIPPYYATNLESISPGQFETARADCQSQGTPFSEEDYLMGCYPPELAEPAREYLKKEKREIVDYLRSQYHSDWFWFRLRRGW